MRHEWRTFSCNEEVIKRVADACELSYDDLMAYADEHVETGKTIYLGANNEYENVPMDWWDDFWTAYKIVRNKEVHNSGRFFRCGC